jgi:hypothetical protein
MRTINHGLSWADKTGAFLPIAGTLIALAILLMILVACAGLSPSPKKFAWAQNKRRRDPILSYGGARPP